MEENGSSGNGTGGGLVFSPDITWLARQILSLRQAGQFQMYDIFLVFTRAYKALLYGTPLAEGTTDMGTEGKAKYGR